MVRPDPPAVACMWLLCRQASRRAQNCPRCLHPWMSSLPAADLARLLARELLGSDFGPVECDNAGHYASLVLTRLAGCGGAAYPLAGARTALVAATELCTLASEAAGTTSGEHSSQWQWLCAFYCCQACDTLEHLTQPLAC
jgi:hypothetical protein